MNWRTFCCSLFFLVCSYENYYDHEVESEWRLLTFGFPPLIFYLSSSKKRWIFCIHIGIFIAVTQSCNWSKIFKPVRSGRLPLCNDFLLTEKSQLQNFWKKLMTDLDCPSSFSQYYIIIDKIQWKCQLLFFHNRALKTSVWY